MQNEKYLTNIGVDTGDVLEWCTNNVVDLEALLQSEALVAKNRT